ncbi:MAG: DUF4013 domain-containing protein [Verrucomicrobiales bacterium]|jgi:hypothetical protein|nr:DUF4013 domain-containing protein [Verrucomicrobiales bacterium]
MSIQFSDACKDIFKTENKWMTILGLSVSMLIPIVGPMVAIGFLLRRFARERQGNPAEDFDFNFFGDYLKMGLWPMLATLVFSLVIVPVVVLFSIAPVIIIPLAENGNETLIIITAIIGFALYFAFLALFTVFSYPIMLRSGLMMDFKSGFSWSFMKSFASKVGLSMIGYLILLSLIAMPLMIVGYFALFVGAYVVAAWMQMAMMHLVYQHYDLMVERGGEQIEINPELTKPLSTPPLPIQSRDSGNDTGG